MTIPIPSSGRYVCSSHMLEKSPEVQPMRQRAVLTAALFHVCRQVQKLRLKGLVLLEPCWCSLVVGFEDEELRRVARTSAVLELLLLRAHFENAILGLKVRDRRPVLANARQGWALIWTSDNAVSQSLSFRRPLSHDGYPLQDISFCFSSDKRN